MPYILYIIFWGWGIGMVLGEEGEGEWWLRRLEEYRGREIKEG